MFNAIKRDSGLFEPDVTDELNNAFSKTLEKIENFHATPLEPKYATSQITMSPIPEMSTFINQSFYIGNALGILNVSFILKDDFVYDAETTDSENLMTINYGGEFLAGIIDESNNSYPVFVQNSKIKCFSKLDKDKQYYLINYFIS